MQTDYTATPDQPEPGLETPPGEPGVDLPVNSMPPAIDPRIKDRDRFLADISGKVTSAIANRSVWQANLLQWHNAYMGIVGVKKFPWTDCSNTFVPQTATYVDTMLARFINPLFAQNPIATARGVSAPGQNSTGPTDHQKARDAEALLHYVLERVIKIYPVCVDWIKEALIYGVGYVKIAWKKDSNKISRYMTLEDLQNEAKVLLQEIQSHGIDEDRARLLMQLKKAIEIHDWQAKPYALVVRIETVYDNPDWIFVPAENMIIDPCASSLQSASFCAERFISNGDSLLKKQDQGIYDNADEAISKCSYSYASGLVAGSVLDVQSQSEGLGAGNLTRSKDGTDPITCFEFHGKIDIDGDGRLEDVIATYSGDESGSGKTLLSAMERPFMHGKKPYAEIKPFPMPGRLIAPGAPELVHSLQMELNNIHNQRTDAGTLLNAPLFRFDPASPFDPDIHTIFPGAGFPGSQGDYEILKMGDVNYSQFREEESIRKMMQDRIAITDIQIGSSDPSITNDTATGISSIIQEQNQRLELVFKNVRFGINEAINQTFQLLQQYGSDMLFYRVVENASESFKSISQKEIQGRFDIELSAVTVSANKAARLNALQQQLMLIGKYGIEYFNPIPLFKEYFEELGSKRAEEIVIPLEEAFMKGLAADPKKLIMVKQKLDQMLQMMMQQMQQAQAGGGGNGQGGAAPQTGGNGQAMMQMMQGMGGMQ